MKRVRRLSEPVSDSGAGRVIVAGAGPVGLTLACELALHGIPTRVLERRAWRTRESRAMGMFSRTLEMYDMRGCADRFVAYGNPAPQLRVGASGQIDFAGLDSKFPFLNIIPQSTTEEILESRARKLGVEIVRGSEIVDLTANDTGVTVVARSATGERTERAAYLVGCDGEHSIVRERMKIPFHGKKDELAAMLGDVRLDSAPVGDVLIQPGGTGVAVMIAYGDGWYRVACLDRRRRWTDEPLTLEELSTALRHILKSDIAPHAPRWLARFRVHERLAAQYRCGRVLLAGDSAHLHSPLGGQGLNLGVQDAMNLGWKLAAAIQGWGWPGLLDTYEAERRPVAADVIRRTGRATAMLASPSPLAIGLRRVVGPRLLAIDKVQQAVRTAISGTSIRYPAQADAGTMAGQRIGDVELVLADGTSVRLYELMHEGRFVLLDVTDDGSVAQVAAHYPGQVLGVAAAARDPERIGRCTALLVRPDGYVAWSTAVANRALLVQQARHALARWCGTGSCVPPDQGVPARSEVRAAGPPRQSLEERRPARDDAPGAGETFGGKRIQDRVSPIAATGTQLPLPVRAAGGTGRTRDEPDRGIRSQVAGAANIVVKVGSSSLTTTAGAIDPDRVDALVDALVQWRTDVRRVILVSSGAIAAGLAPLGLDSRPNDLVTQQALASVGQGLLIARYGASAGRYGIHVGQVLLTAEDMARKTQYRNAYRTLQQLLAIGVLPVVNENDTVATQEIRFGDNDRLAALVAHLIRADLLVLLSDVDGVYDGAASRPESRRIADVHGPSDLAGVELGTAGPSGFGTGGMISKVEAAGMATAAGIPVLLTSLACVSDGLAGRLVGTMFHPTGRGKSSLMPWLASSTTRRGRLRLDPSVASAVLE